MKERKKMRVEMTLKRSQARDYRTAQQQLNLLDKRLGVGVGAKKERERLARGIEESKKK